MLLIQQIWFGRNKWESWINSSQTEAKQQVTSTCWKMSVCLTDIHRWPLCSDHLFENLWWRAKCQTRRWKILWGSFLQTTKYAHEHHLHDSVLQNDDRINTWDPVTCLALSPRWEHVQREPSSRTSYLMLTILRPVAMAARQSSEQVRQDEARGFGLHAVNPEIGTAGVVLVPPV